MAGGMLGGSKGSGGGNIKNQGLPCALGWVRPLMGLEALPKKTSSVEAGAGLGDSRGIL